MKNRAKGWIQDPGSLENLISVVECFDHNTSTHQNLINKIQELVLQQDGRQTLIDQLNSRNGYNNYPKISYRNLVGTAFTPRSNARCNGILQALIPGQRRAFISDWPANNFLRWAETFGFVQYYPEDDSYSITDFGLRLTQSVNLEAKFNIIKEALLQYSPVTRILELLYNQYVTNPDNPLLTKFELGRELGFRGEEGFTTYPQHLVVQTIFLYPSQKNEILTNWEGSSDKYARMICGWLSHSQIRWIEQQPKTVIINIDVQTYTADIPQSYKITILGIKAFQLSRARSRHRRIPKRVYFEMLATKSSDKDYLRTRRAFIIQYLNNWRSLQQIQTHLERNGINDVPLEVIQDDVMNLKRIGLSVNINSRNEFKISDNIIELHIPPLSIPRLIPSFVTQIKNELSSQIRYLEHSFFDLVDLSFDPKQNRLFELRIVELLNLMNDFRAIHLPGGNRPEIIAYSPINMPVNGVIMDAKAYSKGFNIPNSERDKMIRYINEYNQRNSALNRNRWWERFQAPNYPVNPIKFCFVSGDFIGKFLNQVRYIFTQTGNQGGVITSKVLILKVDNVLNPHTTYDLADLFNDLGCNGLVQ